MKGTQGVFDSSILLDDFYMFTTLAAAAYQQPVDWFSGLCCTVWNICLRSTFSPLLHVERTWGTVCMIYFPASLLFTNTHKSRISSSRKLYAHMATHRFAFWYIPTSDPWFRQLTLSVTVCECKMRLKCSCCWFQFLSPELNSEHNCELNWLAHCWLLCWEHLQAVAVRILTAYVAWAVRV